MPNDRFCRSLRERHVESIRVEHPGRGPFSAQGRVSIAHFLWPKALRPAVGRYCVLNITLKAEFRRKRLAAGIMMKDIFSFAVYPVRRSIDGLVPRNCPSSGLRDRAPNSVKIRKHAGPPILEKRTIMAAWRPFLVALTLSAAVMTGCSKNTYGHGSTISPSGTRSDPAVPTEPIVSSDFRAQQSFDSAVDAWKAGRYTEAADRFRYFLHDYPDDALVLRAEVWLARTFLSSNDADAARRAFTELQNRGATPQARALASAYLAFSYQIGGDLRSARSTMERLIQEHPTFHVLESMVAEGDAPLIASMMADTRLRRSAFAQALLDLEVVERSATDEVMKNWALASGMTVAREVLKNPELDQLLHGESTFQRAIAVGARVERALREHQMEIAAGAFHAGSPSLLSHGLEREYAALQNTLALSGTVSAPVFGLAISLTGPDRRAGRAALGGMLLAQRSFEERPRSADMLIEDTAGTPAGVRAAVERLCARGVPVIIGPIESNLASIARESAGQCRATYFGLETLGAPDLQLWRMSFNAYEEGYALAEFAAQQGSRRVLLISEEPRADFLEQVAGSMAQHSQRHGMIIAGHQRVNVNDLQRSSREVASAVRRVQADTIVFAVSSSTATALSSYMAAEGVWPRSAQQPSGPLYLASSFAWSPTLAVNSARYVEGMVLASWLTPTRPIASAFLQSFERTFGRAPGALEAFAFDAASLARTLLLDVGVRDGVDVRRRLLDGFAFEGATGVWRWSEQGQLHAPVLVRISGGQLVSL